MESSRLFCEMLLSFSDYCYYEQIRSFLLGWLCVLMLYRLDSKWIVPYCFFICDVGQNI